MSRTFVFISATMAWIALVYLGQHVGLDLTREEALDKIGGAGVALLMHWLWSKA